ncbi:MAG: hypothetical protein OEZ22_01870 [Spirochaetia bacterium]|nr:hypothetical protein [Spirochaetia bacterium]
MKNINKESLIEIENQKGAYKLKESGFFFEDIFIKNFLNALFNISGWSASTKEVRLEDLGVFPLEEKSKQILREKPQDINNTPMKIPAILEKSNIPVFYGLSNIYLPREAFAACRYFFHSWGFQASQFNEVLNLPDEEKETIIGFFIINSFTGELK